jgi:hypothetical protein
VADRREGLAQHLPVRRLVEAHEERPPLPEGGRPQVTGGPQQEPQQGGPVRLVLAEIHVDDALAPDDVERVDLGEHTEGVPARDRLLLRVHLGGRADPALRKEPLRFRAGLSAVAVVAPVNARHAVTLRVRRSIDSSIQ